MHEDPVSLPDPCLEARQKCLGKNTTQTTMAHPKRAREADEEFKRSAIDNESNLKHAKSDPDTVVEAKSPFNPTIETVRGTLLPALRQRGLDAPDDVFRACGNASGNTTTCTEWVCM